MRLISGTGVCQSAPMPPERPFFSSIGTVENPRNLLWIAGPFATPAPSDSWVEVTHCPVRQNPGNGAPAWRQKPMWVYAAPGSGVSINVGRTHVVHSCEAAMNLLASVFTGEEREGGTLCPSDGRGAPPVELRPTPLPPGQEWHAPLSLVNRSTASRHRPKLPALDAMIAARERAAYEAAQNGNVWLGPAGGDTQTGDARIGNETKAGRDPQTGTESDTAVEAWRLDSIQLVRHGEWFSGEFRHEIILLRHDECSPLDGRVASCGRHPRLFPCPHQTLRRMQACVALTQ